MKCGLCEKAIEKYDARFNHLAIDEVHAVDICSDCISKFVKWHGSNIAKLFPTSAMKKRFGEKEQ